MWLKNIGLGFGTIWDLLKNKCDPDWCIILLVDYFMQFSLRYQVHWIYLSNLSNRDIPRIPESSHPPLESSKTSLKCIFYLDEHHSSVFFFFTYIKNMFYTSSNSGLKFFWVAEDGPSVHLSDVPHQPRCPARPSSGAAWTALGEWHHASKPTVWLNMRR